MKSEDLVAILDFLYCGKTNVYQENFYSFLSIAKELELKGLMGISKGEEEVPINPSGFIAPQNATLKPFPLTPAPLKESSIRTVSLANEQSDDLQKLDEQINSMMTKGSRKNKHGHLLYACNSCGYESKQSHMKSHIEVNHLEGISVPCNFCEKTFRNRNGLRKHRAKDHLAPIQ